ncbi:MAG: response regulator [Magnetococcales bacterium]|nr:response regulator [Magnetococcales bacterium]NGZ27258.1 response regulator [Magnetococcales bacterium]
MKILIADDELNNRILLKEILEPYGECDMVANGAEAVDIFEAELLDGVPYDLVLMDIMMPEMSGQEAVKRIRRIEEDHDVRPANEVIIIMVSALDAPADIVEAFYNGGCTDYITKPFTPQKLMEKLRSNRLLE